VAAPRPLLAAVLCAVSGAQAPRVPADGVVLPEAAPAGLRGAGLVAALAASDAEVALGRRLFFDPRLSRDGTVACATCHDPAHGFADPRPLSVGVDGRRTLRHAPTLYNRALGAAFSWDGRAATLEEQVLLPIENELEMDLPVSDALARLAADDGYRAAFGGAPTADALASALAAFVRRLLVGASRVDRWRDGETGALTAEEQAGMWLFEGRGGCWRCHAGSNLTDEGFHNTGVGARAGEPADGRFGVSGVDADRGRFKTPTLRALAETAPYMHDGSLTTLEQVVEFYSRGGGANAGLDPLLRPLELSDVDAARLVAFLRALSGG
jgi:cytochrome c peroxidase